MTVKPGDMVGYWTYDPSAVNYPASNPVPTPALVVKVDGTTVDLVYFDCTGGTPGNPMYPPLIQGVAGVLYDPENPVSPGGTWKELDPAIEPLADNTGGTANGAMAEVTSQNAVPVTNNNLAELAVKVNSLIERQGG